MMRVRPDVTGSLQLEGATFVELDHDATYADNDPIVQRHPECFEKVPAKKASK